jgi:hypothetical protein
MASMKPAGFARARAAAACIALAAAGLVPIVPVAAAAPAPGCPDLLVGTPELERILDQTLGTFAGLVDERTVRIDPRDSACYVHFSLSTSALAQLGGACRISGCSTILTHPQSIALSPFDVDGCDPLFTTLGLSRHVPSTYVDSRTRIRQQCGSDAFEIAGVRVVDVQGTPMLRIRFRALPPR